MKKQRVEALTDGIIAIAATIMVLDLDIPSANDWSGLLEIRHTFLAYVISFMMIYFVWSMHHDLFKRADVISKRAFLVNGIWIFLLTLVPFTTAWVGDAPDATVPEFLYSLNLLLWSIAFQWLDLQIRKENPGVPRDRATALPVRVIMYGGYILCIILAFIRPILSIYVIGISTVTMLIWFFTKGSADS